MASHSSNTLSSVPTAAKILASSAERSSMNKPYKPFAQRPQTPFRPLTITNTTLGVKLMIPDDAESVTANTVISAPISSTTSIATMSVAPSKPSPAKRKRVEPLTPRKAASTQAITSTNGTSSLDNEVVYESPRTQITSSFDGLQLVGDGQLGQVSKLDFKQGYPQLEHSMDGMEKLRKRHKLKATSLEEKAAVQQEVVELPHRALPLGLAIRRSHSVVPDNESDAALLKHTNRRMGTAARSDLSIGDAAEIRSSLLKATPMKGGKSAHENVDSSRDPGRAELTWHDDEITGFDPDDPDDDGEGINGVGFRPTAARIQQRTLRKRQQLAEYRSRENREARSKRSEARKRETLELNSDTSQVVARRVRFSEGQHALIII